MKRLATIFFSNQRAAALAWVLIDVILINIAFGLAYWVRYRLQLFRAVDPAFDVPYQVYWPFAGLFTLLLILVYRQHGAYRLRRQISWFDEFYAIINGTATGTIIMIVFIFLYQAAFYSRAIFIYAGIFVVILVGLSRLIKVSLLRYLRRRGIGSERVLIVGAGEVARTVMRAVVANPECGFNIIGFLDDNPLKGETDIGRFKALGGLDNLPDVLREQAIDEVIITLPWQYHRKIVSIMTLCERGGIRTRIVPDLFQMTISRMQVEDIAGVPMIGVKEVSISGLNQVVKRSIDLVFACLALVSGAPLMALLALMIKLESPGPVLFRQERVGRNGRCFTVYKFRSMVEGAEEQQEALQELNEADGPLFKIRDDPRMTHVGKLLRKFSLDELPQLYNVLRGEMSLIGPRPPLPAEVKQYQEWHKRRLEVAPGLTGLSQISGRSQLSFDETALLDIYYIENWSLGLDTKILLQTIPRVIFGNGAY
ncbi:MAG: undecaprenyl-phosphate glucose phosphotransferase [Anaerolineales bacterium]|nr:undecaprenyl-phosphate glucose phosphotransferase [Anaerolineales bacterium]